MSFLVDLLIFGLGVVFFFYLPGWLVLYCLRLKLSRLEAITISLISGLLLFTSLNYLLGFLNLRYLTGWLVSGLSLIALLNFWERRKKVFPSFKMSLKPPHRFLILLVVLGIVVQGSIVFFSGLENDKGLAFKGEIHDAFWHLALINELKSHFPPEHPGFASERLTNYHFFYDLLVAGFSNLTKLSGLDLYFRFFPILISLLLGLAAFIAARSFLKSEVAANLVVFLTYFCGNFGYFLPLLRGSGTPWSDFSFWINQTHAALYNPQFALSLPIFLVGFFLFLKYLKEKSLSVLVLASLTLGMLIGFKSYGGVIALGTLLTVSLVEIIFYKRIKVLWLFIASLAVALIVFLPNYRPTENFFIFAPGWFLRAMMENADRLNLPDWVLRENTYITLGDSLGLLRLRVMEFLIFLTGNLGVRILGFGGLLLVISKGFKISLSQLFLLVAAFISFLFPLFFIQKGSVANTIQFAFYFLIIMNFFTTMAIMKLIQKRTSWQKLTLLLLIFLLAVPSSLKMLVGFFTSPVAPTAIPYEELEALSLLGKEPDDEAVVLLYPNKNNLAWMYVSALSGKRSYFSDVIPAAITGEDYQHRIDLSKDFFITDDLEFQRAFLKQNNIAYLYLLTTDETDLSPTKLPLSIVFTNEKVTVYKVD